MTYNLFAIDTSLSVILWFYLSQECVMILKARPFQLAVGAEKDHVIQLVRRLHVLIYTACMYNYLIVLILFSCACVYHHKHTVWVLYSGHA